MNPGYSSISTDQPTVLVPFYFCQKIGRKKTRRGKKHLKQGRESKEKGRLQGNEESNRILISVTILH